MNFSKRIILTVIFLFAVCRSMLLFGEPQRSFLSPYARRIIQESVAVEAAPLASMRKLPSHIWPGDQKYYRILNADQRRKIVELLERTTDIDPQPRLERCKFEPGVNFTFYMKPLVNDETGPRNSGLKSRFESKALSVLLCFNCDLWAIGADTFSVKSQRAEEVAVFGDAKPDRNALEALVMELFGSSFLSSK